MEEKSKWKNLSGNWCEGVLPSFLRSPPTNDFSLFEGAGGKKIKIQKKVAGKQTVIGEHRWKLCSLK